MNAFVFIYVHIFLSHIHVYGTAKVRCFDKILMNVVKSINQINKRAQKRKRSQANTQTNKESKWAGQMCLQQWRENKLECDLNEIWTPEAGIVTTANRTGGIKRQENRDKSNKNKKYRAGS